MVWGGAPEFWEVLQMSKKVAYYGVFAALAILMGYVERFIPMPAPVPGIKPGLANIIILLALYMMDTRSAFFISLVRVFVSALLFAGFAGFFYSAAGAMLSLVVMLAAKKTGKLGVPGVSVLGGVFHNIGQITVASLVVQNAKLFYYLPVLMVSGVVTGIFTGISANAALNAMGKSKA